MLRTTLEIGLSFAALPAGCIVCVCILECDPLSCMFGITLHGKLALSRPTHTNGIELVSTVCACAEFHNILEIADSIVLVSGFLSAFCPRWVQNDIVWIIGVGGGGGGENIGGV